MRHDLFGTQHRRGKWNPPSHGVEHGHDAANAVGCGQAHDVGASHHHGVQIGTAVGIQRAFGLTRCTTGVAQAKGRVFVQYWPGVVR